MKPITHGIETIKKDDLQTKGRVLSKEEQDKLMKAIARFYVWELRQP